MDDIMICSRKHATKQTKRWLVKINDKTNSDPVVFKTRNPKDSKSRLTYSVIFRNISQDRIPDPDLVTPKRRTNWHTRWHTRCGRNPSELMRPLGQADRLVHEEVHPILCYTVTYSLQNCSRIYVRLSNIPQQSRQTAKRYESWRSRSDEQH